MKSLGDGLRAAQGRYLTPQQREFHERNDRRFRWFIAFAFGVPLAAMAWAVFA